MSYSRTTFTAAALIVLLLFLTSCDSERKKRLYSGRTMGTTWHLTLVTDRGSQVKNLQKKIDTRLEEINRSMSIFMGNSEISRFNRLRKPEKPFVISEDFLNVMTVAEQLHRLTHGAWDGTIGPVVDIWGFGKGKKVIRPPQKEQIAAVLKNTGFNGIAVNANGYLIKKNPALHLDLGSIAKGYAVDQLARLLRESKIENFIVEVGGEVVTSGRKMDGSPWRVGLNTPREEASATEVFKTVTLTNQAVATSGDYRNFFESGNKRYSHVINPKTGYPVDNGVVSATIIAGNCTFADGLATAVMVMGPEKALNLINRLDGVEGLIITRDKREKFAEFHSNNFLSYSGSGEK